LSAVIQLASAANGGRATRARRVESMEARVARPFLSATLFGLALVIAAASCVAVAQDTTHNGSLSIVTGTPASTTIVQVSGVTSALVAPAFPTAFSGPTATGTGIETVTMAGSAACVTRTCGISEGLLQNASDASRSGSTRVTFPHGVLSAVIGNCAPGAPIGLRFKFPVALPPGTAFYLYGPTGDNRVAHWYIVPASIDGDTVQVSLTDGGSGDADSSSNGMFVVVGGPGIAAAPLLVTVPGLGTIAISLLVGLLLLAGAWALGREHRSLVMTSVTVLLVLAGAWEFASAMLATAQTTAGPLQATPASLGFASQTLGSISSPKTTTIQNVSAAAVDITSILVQGDFAQTNDCGNILSPAQSCTIGIRFAPSACAPALRPPVLVSANPATLLANGQPQSSVLTGQNFVAGSVVLFDGNVLTTAAQTSTTLSLSVPGGLVANAHSASVQVRNPDNQTSSVIQVPVVSGGALSLTAVNPASVQAYGVAHIVTLTGQGFASGAVASIAGTTLTPQSATAAAMNVTVPGPMLAIAGILPVLVRNPDGKETNQLSLNVTALSDPTLPGPNPVGIKILDPIDGTSLSTLQIPVSGTFVGAEKVVLSNACTPAQLAGNTFSVAAYPLVFGDNVITATAFGTNGARATDTVLVHNGNPIVTLGVPPEIDDDSVLATGTFQGPSNSRVTVNGLTARVNGSTYYVLVPLTSGENTIQATVTTPQAKTHSVSTTIIDTLPMLRIDSPLPAAQLDADHITVSGIFAATSTPSITVNGIASAITGNTFVAQNVPLRHGRNALVAKTLSPTGRTVMRTTTVTNLLPSVTISSPVQGATISATTVKVVGVVTGKQGPTGQPTTVAVNGIVATLSGFRGPYFGPNFSNTWPDGSSYLIQDYTATVPLAAGSNTIAVTALSFSGKTTTKSIVVQRPATVIGITAPTDGATIYNDSAIVTGVIDSSSPVTVAVNGVAAVLNGSVFAARVPLVIGANTISAIATAGSAHTTVSLSVTRAEPSVSITDPSAGSTLNNTRAIVSGTFQGPSGTSVVVNGTVAAISGNLFYAGAVALQKGSNDLVATVIVPDGRSATQTITVTAGASVPDPIEIMVDPANGIAPESIRFLFANNSGSPITHVEIDSRGTGTADVISNGPVNVLNVNYQAAGTFLAKVTVTNAAGAVFTSTQVVEIVSMDQIDTLLRGTYDRMLTRLRAKDVTGALTQVTGGAYAKYSGVFNSIVGQFPSIIDKLGTLQQGSVTGDLAEYVLVRDTATGPQVFLIYFLRGEDGVWRIDGM
jgi:hypothetical protein